jgi:hypothetical protein
MKKLAILFSVLLVFTFVVVSFGCDQAETIIDKAEDIKDKAEDIVSSITPDSDTKDGSSTVAPDMDINSWIKVNTGEWEQTAEGIKVYGAGYREGHQGLQSKTMYNFEGTETRIKWQANGGSGAYAAFWVFLISDYVPETAENSGLVRGGFFTTDHSWKESVVIDVDTWYYTRIVVQPDRQYTAVTAAGNYDDDGGSVIYSGDGEYNHAHNGNIVVIFQDNYGGTETCIMVGEVITNASPIGMTVTSTPSKILEPQDDGIKTILVYPQPGITNATVNDIPIITGQDNQVQIDTNQPLQMKYNFVNSRGNLSEATQDLDTFYDFHVLKANGGWSSTIHRDAYKADKNSP